MPCDAYMEFRDAEDHTLYDVLIRRGSTLLRLAFALAYEAQLSAEEICALNACDFDFVCARVAVRSTPDTFDRFAQFGTVTAIEFFEWARLRDDTVDDGFFGALLHDCRGSRLTPEGTTVASGSAGRNGE